MIEDEVAKVVHDVLEDAELIDIWCWDGDLGQALGVVAGEESKWLVERGVLKTEDDNLHGVNNLIEGDVVYRCRTSRALDQTDPRYDSFDWALVDPFTGAVQS